MKKLKIAIITISLKNGGLERSCANLCNLLSELGHNVHIISINPGSDYELQGIHYTIKKLFIKKTNILNWIKSFIDFKKYLGIHSFDYIIDSRVRQNYIKELLYLFYFYRKMNIYYMVHSSNINHYFTNSKLIGHTIIKNVNKIIAVSNGINSLIKNRFITDNVKTIYNYTPIVTSKIDQEKTKNKDYILFLGRIDNNVKNLSLLLESYKYSNLDGQLQLLIVGTGPDIELIKNQINALDLANNVKLIDFTPNVSPFLFGAKFLVLSSKYEGFPMVLIESLSHGTPVVSVDCDFGPREIIKDQYNGLLVENNNPIALGNAMRKMYFDNDLYSRCANNARESVSFLSKESIAKYWVELLV